MMFFSSTTCRIVLVLAAACNAVTSAKEAKVELSEDHHPVLRGNAAATTAATPVESLDDAHRRMLDVYTGSTANLAVHAGASIMFTHPPTEIKQGNVCAQFAFTGGPLLDYILTEAGTSASSGGCDSKYLVDFLTVAMTKKAMLMPDEMGGEVITPGTYFADSINIADNTQVTLEGGSTDIFLFQSGSAMTTGLNTIFILKDDKGNANTKDGPQAKNILFALNAAATTGAGSSLPGSILAGSAVTLGAGSDVSGYVLATSAMTLGEGCSVNSATIGPSVQAVSSSSPSPDSPIKTLIEAAKCFNDGAKVTCPSTIPL
jgi:hypothetical protein